MNSTFTLTTDSTGKVVASGIITINDNLRLRLCDDGTWIAESKWFTGVNPAKSAYFWRKTDPEQIVAR